MYNVQCLEGHVGAAPEGSELEARCKKWAEKHLDALILGPDECPSCREEQQMRDESMSRMMSL